jgi:protein-disulfide isomerase
VSGPADNDVEDDEGDLTRKQRREQARAQRKQLEEAEAAGAARRTRLTRLGIVAAVVVAAIVVILLATGGGSKGGVVKKGGKEEGKVVGEVTSLLSGVPQNANVLGNPKAPVTLVYYGDLECPICKEFTLQVLPSIVQRWVRTGKVKVEYRSLQTATREPEVFRTQQVAALAAGKQNKMWPFLELFYHQQGEEGSSYVTESYLQRLAQQVPGLSLTKWTSDRSEAALANQITTDAQTASALGFTGTPSFQLGKSGGTLPTFEPGTFGEVAPYNAAIEKLLKS